ncbi:Bug family tripartite tricarboxylate transporter substrate binding protein [Siccirubricoccus phaeus]|uniref:Bug family tripartite tricarboxylate transporter substrate binding protein n=1 Tax=Siccirubricoccus phaeus TaxID=2595053 RepID=UPI0011F2C69A|nr:tripartite tricarboxylate transporter substrate binding protein [Siccirubricoccus phaeus]
MLPRRAVLALPFLSGAAAAQDWPSRPIRLVVPFPPGGSTDLLARRIGEKLSPALGQPVVVENRPGAGGTTGSEMVARAAPDGATILFGVTGTHGVAPSLFPRLGYDPLKDFAPISLVVTAPLVLVVRRDLPARDLAGFIAAAKAAPGDITYGTPGNGTSMHLTGVMFDMQAGTRLSHVPYRGSGPALNDLVAGNLATMFGDLLVVLPQLRAGTIRALAVTGAQRHPLLPEVPTMAEAGLPGFLALSWQGLFAPAGTPPAIVARLANEVHAAVTAPDMREFFASQGFAIEGSAPEVFRALLETEIPKWAAVVKAGQVRLD